MDAYIGCLSGAISRDEYLQAIENAGFRDVNVVDEAQYFDLLNEPGVRSFIEKFNIREEVLKEIAGSTVSIKVQGLK